jgi:hypothetical protein
MATKKGSGLHGELRVRANEDLVLDAGAWTVDGPELVIHPPRVTLFLQVLAYLRTKADPPASATGATVADEGTAAAAVVLRWGSYLAVLADSAKPVWAEARSPGASRISDSEMARINIEASAALSDWVDVCRETPRVYEKLVARALAYLPLPRVKPRSVRSNFEMLAMPEFAATVAGAVYADRLAAVRAEAESHPSRILANALVNTAWRNGPVEDVHAGAFRGYPLDHRRVTIAEERTVMGFAADRLTMGISVCRQLALERPPHTWPEQVLPYGLATAMRITPSRWTLTESTREVRLPRS